MSNNLDSRTVFKAKEEYLRLVGAELIVPTDEQLEKARNTARERGSDFEPRATARVRLEWEPLSYEIRGGDYGNRTSDYLDVSFGLDSADLEAVRAKGWLGIPDNRLIRFNDRVAGEDQQRAWPRFRVLTRNILDLDIDLSNGQITSNSIGRVYRCTEGYESFPRNVQKNGKWIQEGTRDQWMRIPREDVTDTYIAPATPDVRIIESRGEGRVQSPQQATQAASLNLRQAVEDSGMVGMRAVDLARPNQQVAFVVNHMTDTPATIVFGTADVNKAADEGELLAFLESKGALRVNDEGVLE